ncbi:MAG: hypothetical protein ACTSPB_19200 [Candidatus Thorarchaeota archaeon]
MKGIAITSDVVVFLVFLMVAVLILQGVSAIGSKVAAESWRRSAYYISSRVADAITGIAYSDVTYLEFDVDLNDEDVESCEMSLFKDDVYTYVRARITYRGDHTISSERYTVPRGTDVTFDGGNEIDCRGITSFQIQEDPSTSTINVIGVRV